MKANSDSNIYATPREVKDIKDCEFYHIMDIPGIGTVGNEWDLRQNINEYLGHVNFAGKRVLEVGTASGFICFFLERQQAEVIAVDLSPEFEWDIVPMAQFDYNKLIVEYKELIRKLNNGFWYAHKIFNSKAKVVYSPVYQIPNEIGKVDISIFGDILLHLQNPFMALKRALDLTREKVIITDLYDPLVVRKDSFLRLCKLLLKNIFRIRIPNPPYMVFLPDFKSLNHKTDWWKLSPEIIVKMIGLLGFEKTHVSFHKQKYKNGQLLQHFTVVGERTRPLA